VVERLRVFRHVGFFCSWLGKTLTIITGGSPMEKLDPSVAQQIAQAAIAFQQHQVIGHKNMDILPC
jgi:hypothetical protein